MMLLVPWMRPSDLTTGVTVSDRTRAAGARNLLFVMVGAGLAIGAVFPVAAGLFVEPKSPAALAGFWGMALAAGVGLGAACYKITTVAAERLFSDVLIEMAALLKVPVSHARGIAGIRTELLREAEELGRVLTRIQAAAEDVRSLSAEVLAATEQQASGAAEQAAAVSQTSATVEELAQTSKQIAENSASVVSVAERTLASAEEGMQSVADTSLGIEEIRSTTSAASDRILALGERSQEIGRVLTIIDEIAEQTKILALNAAIEAARAGDAGKGFAVVAEEIRKLADSVTESTQEIGRVVREIQASTSALIMSTERAGSKVDEGKALAQRTAEALKRIVAQVEETTDAAKQISIATQQQRTASDQVVVSMREVSSVSQQSAETSRQISAAIMKLDTLADALKAVR